MVRAWCTLIGCGPPSVQERRTGRLLRGGGPNSPLLSFGGGGGGKQEVVGEFGSLRATNHLSAESTIIKSTSKHSLNLSLP